MTPMGVLQVKSLLIIASQLSGYPIPAEPPPTVEIITAKEMVHEGCDDSAAAVVLGCPIIGFYERPPNERIVIENDPDVAGHSVNAIAVHELTHWLQHRNWKNPDLGDCPREFMREYEAYRATYQYEVTYEHSKAPEDFSVPSVDCPFTVEK